MTVAHTGAVDSAPPSALLGKQIMHFDHSLLAIAGGILTISLLAPVWRATAQENHPPTQRPSVDPARAVDIVDALKAVVGNPKGARATFAKGQCVRGTYTPSDQAS